MQFSWLSPIFSYLLLMFGIVQSASAALCYFTPAKDYDTRRYYTNILAFFLLFDAFVMHFPFSAVERDMGKEFSHFYSDFAILGGLLMLLGYRGSDNID